MTITRRGSATLEFPSDCEVLITRKFDASAELLFDVLTKPEHVRVWFTGGDEVLEVCEIDLRVGGEYRHVGVFPRRREVRLPRHLPRDRAPGADRGDLGVRGAAGRRGRGDDRRCTRRTASRR